MDFKPPKASEAIAAIQALIDEHGDLPIALNDPDTQWVMPIGVDVDIIDGQSLIMITSTYYGKPHGCIGNIQRDD